MAIKLRPYQEKQMVQPLRKRLRHGVSRIVLQAPTGAGKSAVLTYMATEAARRGYSTTFVVHRKELLQQISDALTEHGAEHGLIAPGHPRTGHKIQVATVQTLVNRLGQATPPDLLVFDECHHAAARTWQRVIEAWPSVRMIGLTATPCRTDGQGLDDVFTDLVIGPRVRDLIDEGYLAEYAVFAPKTKIELAKVEAQAGDYKRSQLDQAANNAQVTGDAVDHYRRIAMGRRAVAFCVSVDHAKHVARSFQQAGIPADYIAGNMGASERTEKIDDFTAGRTKVLASVDLLIEGVDIPCIEAAIILRPTKSLVVYLQMIGRSLRPAPGKDRALILDHAATVIEHGLPDEDRSWSLAGRQKGEAKEAAPAVTQCPECFAAHAPAPRCPECGHVYAPQGRQPQAEDGELRAVNAQDVETARAAQQRRKREQAQCKTFDELVELGRQRGYDKPVGWARHIWRARQKKQGVPA